MPRYYLKPDTDMSHYSKLPQWEADPHKGGRRISTADARRLIKEGVKADVRFEHTRFDKESGRYFSSQIEN